MADRPQYDPTLNRDFFAPATEHAAEAYEQKTSGGFENQATRKFLRYAGLSAKKVAQEMRNDGHESRHLLLRYIREAYPEIDWVMYADRVSYVFKILFADFEKRFTNTNVFKKYRDLIKENDHDTNEDKVALIFNIPQAGPHVLYNKCKLVDPSTVPVTSGWWSHVVYNSNKSYNEYTVEHLKSFALNFHKEGTEDE